MDTHIPLDKGCFQPQYIWGAYNDSSGVGLEGVSGTHYVFTVDGGLFWYNLIELYPLDFNS